jgi:hypothetical protein
VSPAASLRIVALAAMFTLSGCSLSVTPTPVPPTPEPTPSRPVAQCYGYPPGVVQSGIEDAESILVYPNPGHVEVQNRLPLGIDKVNCFVSYVASTGPRELERYYKDSLTRDGWTQGKTPYLLEKDNSPIEEGMSFWRPAENSGCASLEWLVITATNHVSVTTTVQINGHGITQPILDLDCHDTVP